MYESDAALGAKLQALVAADCISSDHAAALPAAQKSAIENLSQSQVDTVIAVHVSVGPVASGQVI